MRSLKYSLGFTKPSETVAKRLCLLSLLLSFATLNKNQLMDIDSTNSQHLRDYTYDNNGNQRTQTINGINTATTTTTLYMRSNLVRSHSISSANNNQLSYEYNNHDDRVYKNTPTNSTYYLRDASGKELAMLNVTTNTWTHYAYGRERVAELSTGPATFYNYDHLGSVRVVYQADANCSRGKSLQYTIASANDYFPFGKTLRSFNNSTKYAYQGSEKDKELGDGTYYTHYRELDVDGRMSWEQVDPKMETDMSWSPYVSMLNNPVMNTDVNGDWPPNDLPIFNLISIAKLFKAFDRYMKTNQTLKAIDRNVVGHAPDGKPAITYLHGDMPMGETTKNNNVSGHVDNMTDDKLPGGTLGTAGAKSQIFRYTPSPLKININDISKNSNINGMADAISGSGVDKVVDKLLKIENKPKSDSIEMPITLHSQDGNSKTIITYKVKDIEDYNKGKLGSIVKKETVKTR